MTIVRAWLAKLFAIGRRRDIDDDLRAEIEAHLRMEAEANAAPGMSPEAALDAARRTFGNRTAIRESSREAWTFFWLEGLLQDLRYGLRLLRRSPGFAFTSVVVIALGIGANTAAFTVLDHVLVRPLPFPDPDRLVMLYQSEVARGNARTEATPPNFEDWRRLNRSFGAMGAYIPGSVPVNLAGQGDPVRLDAIFSEASLFEVLGVQPVVGRTIVKSDERNDAALVTLVSHGLAISLFGGVEAALGKTVRIDGKTSTVVGVMPANFFFPYRDVDVWIPIRDIPPAAWRSRTNHILDVVARLQPGVSLAEARADLEVVSAQLERAYPKENEGVVAKAVGMRDVVSPQSRTLVLAVFGAASCLMLIACTNLANLLFARAVQRRPELAVRMAIGAARPRIVRQLVTETAVLSVLGGSLGFLLALLALPSLTMVVPITLPMDATPDMNWRVFVFAVAITAATAFAFGVGPALRSSRNVDLNVLRSRTGLGLRAERLRAALVVVEVAGTVALLVAAGLLLKAMWRVQSVDPGFHAGGVLTMQTAIPMSTSPASRREFYSSVLTKARSLPGVASAGYISFLPMTFPAGNLEVTVPGLTLAGEVRAHTRFITSDYFRTLGIPILKGRDVSDEDSSDAARVTVISQSLSERLWPSQDPIGRQLTLAGVTWTVVGMTRDVAVRGLDRASLPQAYFPSDQIPPNLAFYAPKDLVVRASGDPMALVPALRTIIRDAQPDLSLSNVRLLEDVVASQTASRGDQLRVLGAFAAIAFVLAAIGIHGVLSFVVSTRTQEVGVRVALGAERASILAMFLRQGLTLGIAGVLAAMPLAYAGARGMRALLFGVEPGDPAVYASAIVVVLLMTLAGSLRPAVRAAAIDPAATIRAE